MTKDATSEIAFQKCSVIIQGYPPCAQEQTRGFLVSPGILLRQLRQPDQPRGRRESIRCMKLSFWRRAAWPVALACGLLAASAPARAATLSGPVNGWASGVPSYVSMYEYVPAKLASPPAV